MGNCARCEFKAGPLEVPAKIPDRPLAAVIGSFPNAEDEKALEAFSDQFGKLLKLALKNQGVEEDDVIYLHSLRCAPRGKAIKDIHLNACRNWVDVDLKKLRDLPERLILICGKDPMDSLLNELELEGGYTSNRGKWIDYKGSSFLITFPPKYVADMSAFREDKPGMWWSPLGSVSYFWFQDLAVFGKRVRALKEKLGLVGETL
jgi:uracil-DNA glycosylase